jgi:hypothetical protein
MSLDTQKFGITRYWLMVALDRIPSEPEIFATKNPCVARKLFLAGSRQLPGIKNWLTCAGIISGGHGGVALTELGRLMAAQDPRAEQAWTWWLFHLHLCMNKDAFPYSTFFLLFDSDGNRWWAVERIVEELFKANGDDGNGVAVTTIQTYFEGVERTFRPGGFVYDLGMVERRKVDEESRIRRCPARPADIVVAYATVLFHKLFLDSTTVEARRFLEKGLGRFLGMKDYDVREAWTRISRHSELSGFFQYRHQVNIDSVEFFRAGDPAIISIRRQVYSNHDVKWP